ncbi:MAG TPA: response regulator [Polyangiales bacterium]|nr:response regulator [Polyangiales bacterium]
MHFPTRHRGPNTLGYKRIVIVDDDDDAREILRLVLEGCSAEVVEASNAEEAMRALETWPADLLISDIGMPGRDGYALIREVRVAPVLALLPAIALTSYTSGSDQARALHAGFDVHLGKPMNAEALITTVAALLQRRKR